MYDLSICIITMEEDLTFLEGCLQSIPKSVETIITKTIPTDDIFYLESPIINLVKEQDNIKFCEWKYFKSGDKFDQTKNNFSFSKAKNACKSFATKKFILFLDSDERLVIEKDELTMFSSMPDYVGGCNVSVHSYNMPTNGGLGQRQTMAITRIFRNSLNINYENRCHEQVINDILKAGLKLTDTSILIKHLGYYGTDENRTYEKMYRNISLMSSELKINPLDSYMAERTFATLNLLHGTKKLSIQGVPVIPNIPEIGFTCRAYGITIQADMKQLNDNIMAMATILEKDPYNHMALANQYINLYVYKQAGGFIDGIN